MDFSKLTHFFWIHESVLKIGCSLDNSDSASARSRGMRELKYTYTFLRASFINDGGHFVK